jgi:hypothetical protein
MIAALGRAHQCMGVALGLCLVLLVHGGAQQDAVGMTELTPTLLVFSTAAGNVVASVGPDGALLVGTPPAATRRASATSLLAGPSPQFVTS